jgi:hypothetical protein
MQVVSKNNISQDLLLLGGKIVLLIFRVHEQYQDAVLLDRFVLR